MTLPQPSRLPAGLDTGNQSMVDTLGSTAWVTANAAALRALFPETFTHPANINFLSIGYNFKLLGIDWRSDRDFAACLAILETLGITCREGTLLKRGKE